MSCNLHGETQQQNNVTKSVRGREATAAKSLGDALLCPLPSLHALVADKSRLEHEPTNIPGNEVLSPVTDGVPVLLVERELPPLDLLEQPVLLGVAVFTVARHFAARNENQEKKEKKKKKRHRHQDTPTSQRASTMTTRQ